MAELKKTFQRLASDADRQLANSYFANAQASYTHALQLEIPNAEANAAIHYNRAACARKLGNLHLSLRDASAAAKMTKDGALSVRAWWRAAEAALALGDVEEAEAAAKAGLAIRPSCVALRRVLASIHSDAKGV